MNPDFIPDPETMALYKTKWKDCARYYLFLSDDGCFVVRHEKHVYRSDPEKNWERMDRLGFFWNIQMSLPEKVKREFAAAIVEYNGLSLKEIR